MISFHICRFMVAILVIVRCPETAIPTWRKILHAFLDWQAESDVWFQWASSCASLIVNSWLWAAAEEAAPAITRETHGDTSAQIPAYWMCGGWGWWRWGPAWHSQIPATPQPATSEPPSQTAPELSPTFIQVQQTAEYLA
jgi:hypothetical protein